MSRFGGLRHGWKHYVEKWTSLRTSSASSTSAPTTVTELDYTKAGGIWNLDSTVQFRGGEPPLYEFTSHTFKSIVAAGSHTGPSLAQMRSAYSGVSWAQDNNYFTSATNGYQRWTVPKTGLYSISLGGAAGGDGLTGYSGNSTITSNLTRGALLDGIQIKLYSGDKLDIVVGVKGGSSGGAHGNENGGGGGTWIYKSTVAGGASGLLLVAGGGGGNPSATNGTSCSRGASQATSYGHGQITNAGGIPGNCNGTPSTPSLGYGGTTTGSYMGGAGGGYNSAGATGGTHCSPSYGGGSYFNGLVGGAGNSCYNPDNYGGFGGGGGGQLGGPGGGGGYTGGSTNGGWSSYSTYGGGGGSYIKIHSDVTSYGTSTIGGNTYNYGGYTGSGFVTITKL